MTDLVPVTSSNIAAIGYDPTLGTLSIKFKSNGQVYSYLAVPPEVHDALTKAESIGRYFAQHIRGAYAYTTVQKETP